MLAFLRIQCPWQTAYIRKGLCEYDPLLQQIRHHVKAVGIFGLVGNAFVLTLPVIFFQFFIGYLLRVVGKYFIEKAAHKSAVVYYYLQSGCDPLNQFCCIAVILFAVWQPPQ